MQHVFGICSYKTYLDFEKTMPSGTKIISTFTLIINVDFIFLS